MRLQVPSLLCVVDAMVDGSMSVMIVGVWDDVDCC